MALDKFTQITKSGIVTTINFECHHLYSTGIATFSSGNISAGGNVTAVDGTFSGNVSVGGTLTYQDVTNIDSVGLVTARTGVRVTAGGIDVTAGVSTFAAAIDANGGVDISGGSGLVASTAKISDLTDNRVVIGGSSGELEDSANLTFDGSNLGVGSKVTVTNANADSRNLNSLGADINAAWIRIGDKAAAKTFTNGLGIKFYDQGTAHWSTGTIGNQYYVSYTGSAGDELFPSSRVDALNFNTTGAAVFASDITAGGNLYIPDKIYHSGDTDTFISFPAADTITAETGGSSRFKIDSSGNVTIGNDGDSGSGPSAGYDELCIEGGNEDIGMCFLSPAANNVTHQISFGDSNNNQAGRIIYNHASDYMALHANSDERLRIDSSGRLGIGITNPDTYLHIKKSATTTYAKIESSHSSSSYTGLAFKTATLNFQIWNQGPGNTSGYSGANSVVFWQSAATGPYAFYHGNDERLRITSSGNVGINSTIPRSKLHAANGSSNYNPGNPTGLGAGAVACLESSGDVALQFLSSTTTDNFIYFGDTSSATTGSIQYDHNVNDLIFNVNGGTQRLRIDNTGKVGINRTTTLDGLLDVKGVDDDSIKFSASTYGGGHLRIAGADGTIAGVAGPYSHTTRFKTKSQNSNGGNGAERDALILHHEGWSGLHIASIPTGQLAVGLTAPEGQLHVYSANRYIQELEAQSGITAGTTSGTIYKQQYTTTAGSSRRLGFFGIKRTGGSGHQTANFVMEMCPDNSTNLGLASPASNTTAFEFKPNGQMWVKSGGGIDFSSAADVASGETISSSVLNDYEEGTYAPTISNLGNHTASSNTEGSYTKIGDTVTVRFRYFWTSRSTTNGAYSVTVSLPFTGSSIKHPGGGYLAVEGCQPNASDRTSYHCTVPQSQAYVLFRCSGANVSENSFNGAISTSLSSGYFIGVVSYKTT